MMFRILFVISLIYVQFLSAQNSSSDRNWKLTGDFRFRLEQDWNSRKSDGSYRDDRSRMRYRARLGVAYFPAKWATMGLRIRSGYPEKQQDPHLTIGDNYEEFNSVPIGLEKLYVAFDINGFEAWLGKNTYPFEKQNELFWSDNVYPEGLFLGVNLSFDNAWIDRLRFGGAHFIMVADGTTFSNDSYIQGIQLTTVHLEERLKIFPGFLFFHKMPDIPDGNENYRFNYSILHIGSNYQLMKSPSLILGLDWYMNMEDYSNVQDIPEELADQKQGVVPSVLLGSLKKKNDWVVGLFYTYLERYAAVDFIAQNDWTRWDYSQAGSRDGRLTNFKGLELMAGYRISSFMSLKMRYFKVEQIVPYGSHLETGDRIRLDLDIGF